MATAVVTGSSRGIGRAIALEFAARGHAVVINSRSDVGGGARVVGEIELRGGKAAYVKGDVSTGVGVGAVFEFANSMFGPVTLLVNNAGGTTAAALGQWSEAHWSEMLNTNLVSVALMSQAFAGQVGMEQGSIVNVGSIRGLPRYSRLVVAAYSAAKAGVINLTAALARELAPRVTVNSVSLGFVDTELLSPPDEGLKRQWLSAMPIGRFIEPAEVATFVALLAEQRSVTGEDVVMDGGWSLADS
jgi:3-oxoacyl-[acyl-carrier protein] reductase